MKSNTTLLNILLLSLFLSSCNKPDGKLSGVATYYFNENYGDKPDVGAKIYIVNSDSVKVNFIEDFGRAKSSMGLIESQEHLKSSLNSIIETYTISLNKPYYTKKEKDEKRKAIEEYQTQLAGIDIDTSYAQKYQDIGDSAFLQIIDLQNKSKIFIADGAGTYSTNLRPNKYFVLIQSNHRNGNTLADYKGQIYFQSVTIESEKETTANAKFSID